LKEKVYSALHDLAIFTRAYAQKHRRALTSFLNWSPKHWGIFPEFRRAQDASVRFAWRVDVSTAPPKRQRALNGDAATRAVALSRGKIAPIPTAERKRHGLNYYSRTTPEERGDHPWYIGVYPTTLSEEITLDSSEVRSCADDPHAYSAPARRNAEVARSTEPVPTRSPT